MSDFATFVQVGFSHIASLGAADHVLFLLALAAIYRARDWKPALWVITAFTVGHSVTLVLAVTGALTLPTDLIEFLIPVTIVATAVENLFVSDRPTAPWRGRYRPLFAGVFGLIHGAGFANALRELFIDRIALPLFGFNVGIELGQIVVLLVAFLLLAALDRAIAFVPLRERSPSPFRLRVLGVSAMVALVATYWAIQRWPA